MLQFLLQANKPKLLALLLFGWFIPTRVPAFVSSQQLAASLFIIAPEAEADAARTKLKKPKTVYFISGLAADARLFNNLQLPDSIQVKHIVWIEPLKAESMESYCRRLASQIDTTEEFSLVGISFGGMVGVELNKFTRPQKTILVSSIVTSNSLSRFFRIVDKFKFHKLLPVWVYKHFYQGAFWFFGAKNEEQRNLIVDLMDAASPKVLKWSIDQLISWKNDFVPKHTFIIVGDKDRVFPHKRIPADTLIAGGTHMMIYTRGAEISQILIQELSDKP